MTKTDIKSITVFLLTAAACITLQYIYGLKVKKNGQKSSRKTSLLNDACSRPTCDVIVVGAGAAGIAAAHTLIHAGLSVVVLEGNDYIGGRVRSGRLQRNLSSDNEIDRSFITVGMGANWIHNLNSDINPLYSEAKRLGLALQVTSPDDDPGDDILLYMDGEQIQKNIYNDSVARYSWMKENFNSFFETDEVSRNKSVYEAFENLCEASNEFFGPCSDIERKCIHWFYNRLSIDLAAPLPEVSISSMLEGMSDGEFGEGLVHGGMSTIIDPLAKSIQDHVFLGHIVESVKLKYRDNKSPFVFVQCANGSSWDARIGCIITAPLSMLKEDSISFSETPSCITKLVQSPLELGLMNIVWVLYPYQFWSDGINFLGTLCTEDFSTFLIPDIKDSVGKKQAVLMCQVVGPFAQAIQTMDEYEVAAIATRRLRISLPKDMHIPDAVGCCFSKWGLQKLIKGSWSYYPTSRAQKENSVENVFFGNSALEESLDIDRFVFYAGEAMSIEQRGTVHGAYLSGVETAMKIIKNITVGT